MNELIAENAVPETIELQQPAALKIAAKIISYVFHPLFIPTYIFFWLTIRFPFEFAGITPMGMFARKFNVFWITAFFPAFSVFLLWRLKFIDNIFLRTQRERVAPYIISMIFYWWMWYLSRGFTDQPIVLKVFYFGIFLITIFGLMINNFFKISMHTIGAGSLLAFVLICCFYYQIVLGIDVAVVIFITGLVATARLLLNHHSTSEIYAGLLVGILCQMIGYAAML